MGIAAYNRGSRAISDYITQQSAARKQIKAKPREDVAPDGQPWQVREPNRPTSHADNGWQYHYPTR